MTDKLAVAVITEWHPFDVGSFQALLWSMPDIDFYPQAWDIFTQDPDRGSYDALLFYNMSFPAPAPDDPRRHYVEEELGANGQGIVLLHHAILSYEEWDAWDGVSGTKDRSFTFHRDQDLDFVVTDPSNPVTSGLSRFSFSDESYKMAEPVATSEVLITTQHENSLQAIAWTHTYRDSRVVCYQSGHDDSAWSDPSFRTVLHNSLRWVSREE